MTDSKPPEQRDEQEQEKWYGKTRYQLLLFGGGIALFGLILGLVLDWYIDPQNPTQRKDLAQTLGLITAGVAGAIGIFFTWRGQRLAREAQEANQRNTLEQLDLTRRGQMTERFTQAIEQLGSEKLEIRLGGIYSLERTAQEEKNYHWPVMEVLTSYVRRHAPRNSESESSGEHVPSPEPDVQAILTVIGRRSRYHKDVEYGPIDLHGTDLRRADLYEASLAGANLVEANLAGSNLAKANLTGAYLQKSSLEGANLIRTALQGASLYEANLQEALLRITDLQEATLEGADLRRASLEMTDLQRASLSGADLREANFQGPLLQEAQLRGADLRGTTGLTQEQIEQANGDESTLLPDHLKHPASWNKNLDEPVDSN